MMGDWRCEGAGLNEVVTQGVKAYREVDRVYLVHFSVA